MAGLRTRGADLVDVDGQCVRLRGVNWFGFNNGTTMVDGLWGGDPLTVDFAAVVHRQMLLGFNAVRLPFSFKDLHTLPPRDFRLALPRPTDRDIAASVLPLGVALPEGITIPPLPTPPPPGATCNEYLPCDTTLARFLWVASFYAANGFYVLLDNHLLEDPTAAHDPAAWAQLWAQLACKPSLTNLYLMAMDAIHAVAPGLLFLLEGAGQQGLGANWGDGFCCDPDLILSHGLSDPNPLFRAILQKPYREQVVLCPHVYGPAVTHASDRWAGAPLHRRLSQSFGWATQQGFSDGTTRQLFPVVVGEFGSFFAQDAERRSMADLAEYLNATGEGDDGCHRPISSWFYWCWNCNSGDTGGLVGDDWRSIQWQKIGFLTSLGLQPWFALWENPPPAVQSHSPHRDSTSGETTATASMALPAATIPETPPSTELQAFDVRAQMGNAWAEADGCAVDVSFAVSTRGAAAVPVPWTLAIRNPAYTRVLKAWNCTALLRGPGAIEVNASEEWQKLAGNGANAPTCGLVVCGSSRELAPQEAQLNGSFCRITLAGS